VGARGDSGLAGTQLGSVSLQVAQRAPCPAVIVPSDR
jgi:nucleotide-binding universal stress UspA family protein